MVNHGKPNNINNNTSPKYLKVITLMVGKPPQMPPGLPITSSPMPHAPPRPQACRQTSAPPRRPLTQSSPPAPDSDVGIIWRLRMTTGRLNRTEPGASDGGTIKRQVGIGMFQTLRRGKSNAWCNMQTHWGSGWKLDKSKMSVNWQSLFLYFYMICELKQWRGGYLWFINIYHPYDNSP